MNLCFALSSIAVEDHLEQIFRRLVLIVRPFFKKEVSIAKSNALNLLCLGNPNDIANACVRLLSDASRWMTGSNLVVDGGYTTR